MEKHILLTTVGSAGDLLPILGLGVGLKRRGHSVSVICASIYESEVAAAGLGFLPVGSEAEMQAIMDDPDLWHPIRAFEVVARKAVLPLMRPIYEHIRTFDPANTLIVGSSFAFGARLAQETHGYRLLTVHLQASILMSAHEPAEMGGFHLPKWLPLGMRRRMVAEMERFGIDRILAPELNAFREDLGLQPIGQIFTAWMNSPDGVLGLFPEWFSPPQPDWPPKMHLTGFIKYETGPQALSSEVEAFLGAGEPPLVFTAGSANVHGAAFFRTAVDAARTLGRRAILLTRFKEQVPATLPENILHVEWVPMSNLLPRTALLVHHGGVGTTAQALSAGIPQLITPLAHDQFDNANRLAALGVGARLDPKRFNLRRAVPVLQKLLEDEGVAARCGEVSQKVDFEKALEDTCEVIERVIR